MACVQCAHLMIFWLTSVWSCFIQDSQNQRSWKNVSLFAIFFLEKRLPKILKNVHAWRAKLVAKNSIYAVISANEGNGFVAQVWFNIKLLERSHITLDLTWLDWQKFDFVRRSNKVSVVCVCTVRTFIYIRATWNAIGTPCMPSFIIKRMDCIYSFYAHTHILFLFYLPPSLLHHPLAHILRSEKQHERAFSWSKNDVKRPRNTHKKNMSLLLM